MINSNRISILCSLAVVLLFASQASAKSETQQFNLDQEWQKTKDTGGIPDGMWSLKSNKDIYVTTMSRDFIAPKSEFEESKIKEILTEMTKGRNAALSLIGIDDWHITDNQLKKDKTQILLTIHGAFHDTHANPIEFKEVHVWQRTKYRSLTINYPKKSKFGESQKPAQVMNRFISSVNEGEK